MTRALSTPEFTVLVACRDGVPRTQRELAAATGLSVGYVNRTLRSLWSAGFLHGGAVTADGWAALEPYRVTNAIILAAGGGLLNSRSGVVPTSYERPKGLLKVRGEILVERQIRQLQAVGITDITVVVGYHQEQFLYLEDAFKVSVVYNPDWASRHTNATIRAVQARLANTYLCRCDTYFAENVFEPYAHTSFHAAVWQAEPTSHEWALEATPSGHIVRAWQGCENAWVMKGVAYWDKAFGRAFGAILDEVYDRPETASKPWEALYAEHVRELGMRLRRYEPGVIVEFDTLDDLRAFDPEFLDNIDPSILTNICAVLGCQRGDLAGFTPLEGGLTNLSFRFQARGESYVYRYPGAATRGILNRVAEAQAEAIAADLGLDETFLGLDAQTGWKLARYCEPSEPFDYHDPRHVRLALAALRRLHTCGRAVSGRFDLADRADVLKLRLLDGGGIAGHHRLDFPDFTLLNERARRLADLSAQDQVPPVLCHNDFYAPNILVCGERVSVIDWEYAGMGDPAGDLGTFIACSDYDWSGVQAAIAEYFGRTPSPVELRHAVAYVSLASFFWWVWALYKDACGEPVGAWTALWYRNAKLYGEAALRLYGVPDQGADGLRGVASDERSGRRMP